MTVYFIRGTAAVLLSAFVAQAAQADLTAQDVWSDWREYLSSSGYNVSGTESMSGDTLTISDITMVLPVPEEDMNVTVVISSLALVQNGDGTVNVNFPSPMPIRFSVGESGEEEVDGELVVTHSGSVMSIAGDPSNMTYTHSSDETAMSLGSLTVDGEAVPADTFRFNLAMAATSGVTKMMLGELRSFEQTFSADSLSYDVAFDDPESEDQGAFTGALQGVDFTGTGSIPLKMDTSNMAAMVAAGFRVDGGFSYDSGNTSLEGTGDGESFSATSASDGGSLAFGMDETNLSYDLSGMNMKVSVTTSALPFPVDLQMAESAFKLDMPVARSEEPQDFAFGLTLADFTMSDMIWGIFDPAANLPRDPATVAVDLSGKAKMLFDLLDPESAAKAGSSPTPPAELNSIDINNLLVSLVGAKLTGTGGFTFDNSDLQTFGGIPRPAGEVNVELVGANALIDKLIAMGFVSDQDAMGARMMMGMLAVPGDGPDTLKSKIEINEAGHVMANGQRIK